MNAATEIAIRWYLDQQGTPDFLADDLIDTLHKGCANAEEDSIQLRDGLLATISQVEKEEPSKSIVDMALALHAEIEGVDKAIHNLGQLKAISEAVEKMPDNAFAKRITAMKIKEAVGRLRT